MASRGLQLAERWRQWFDARSPLDQGPITLNRRQIYILPTGTGVFFAVVLVVMYLGAVNYNLGLGHALVFLLAGLGLVGMVESFRNLVGLTLSAGPVSPVFAGETAHFRVVFDNARNEIRPALVLQKTGPNATPTIGSDLGAKSRQAITLPLTASQRGRLTLGRLTLSTRYPLGLFRAWAHPHLPLTCLVYPAPIWRALPSPVLAATRGGQQHETGDEDFAGFRHREPGDSPRHVAWKVYARQADNQPLLIKTFSGGAQAERWLDFRQLTGPAEVRLSVLCGWVLQARRAGLRYGLRLPNLVLPPDEGDRHADRCLEALALCDVGTPEPSA